MGSISLQRSLASVTYLELRSSVTNLRTSHPHTKRVPVPFSSRWRGKPTGSIRPTEEIITTQLVSCLTQSFRVPTATGSRHGLSWLLTQRGGGGGGRRQGDSPESIQGVIQRTTSITLKATPTTLVGDSFSLGRYFPANPTGSKYDFSRKNHNHRVSERLLLAKDGVPYPESWASCTASYLKSIRRPHVSGWRPFIVCSIPSGSTTGIGSDR